MAKYRAGVVGLGRMGSTFDDEIERGGMVFLPYCHAPSYFHSPLVDLVAGADLDAGQRSLFGERWGVGPEHLYEDYNEMVAKERLDIVSVCTSSRHRSRIVQDLAPRRCQGHLGREADLAEPGGSGRDGACLSGGGRAVGH